MSTEQNKALVRRFYEEVWNKGNYHVAARWRLHGTYKETGQPLTDYTAQNMWRIQGRQAGGSSQQPR